MNDRQDVKIRQGARRRARQGFRKNARRNFRKIRRRLGALFLLLAVALGLFWAVGRRALPPPAVLPSESIYLFDAESGDVLFAQNETQPRAIASLTKLMTALLVTESGVDLDSTITIPQHLEAEFASIRLAGGVTMELNVGEAIRRIDLLYGMLLPSANDAASALADASAGSIENFVAEMNQRAAELGCASTHFACVHGLYDAGNYSTAEDLAKIAVACYTDATLRQITCTVKATLPATNAHAARELVSTNPMQDPDSEYYRSYIRGMKTGFTEEAGRCFVTFACIGGRTYGLVVLGSNRNAIYQECAALLDWVRLTH
jgi:D-alanyl-D-alanine carboxypeptidase